MTLPEPDDYGRLGLASEWLATHAGGDIDRKLGTSMRELIGAVMNLGKGGNVTLKLAVSQLDDLSVVITPEVKATIPLPPSRAQHFFVDAEGYLAVRDPYRQVLPFPTHDFTAKED